MTDRSFTINASLCEARIDTTRTLSMNRAAHDQSRSHTIQQHPTWDNARRPAITIAPGDCVEFRVITRRWPLYSLATATCSYSRCTSVPPPSGLAA
jgi:hypothetical protein